MMNPMHELQKLVGHIIASILLELYLYEGETDPLVNDVELAFDNGVSLLLGCSGDGSVFVRRGKARVRTGLDGVQHAEIVTLSVVVGAKLDAVEYGDDFIGLMAHKDRLTFQNVDDELVLLLNGEQVTVSF